MRSLVFKQSLSFACKMCASFCPLGSLECIDLQRRGHFKLWVAIWHWPRIPSLKPPVPFSRHETGEHWPKIIEQGNQMSENRSRASGGVASRLEWRLQWKGHHHHQGRTSLEACVVQATSEDENGPYKGIIVFFKKNTLNSKRPLNTGNCGSCRSAPFNGRITPTTSKGRIKR